MKNLKVIIKKWQTKLGLLDWKISFEIVDQFERKDNYPQTGDIKVDVRNKKAAILIFKKSKNLEEIVVHELIHLLLWYWDHSIEKSAKNKHAREKHLGVLEQTVAHLTSVLLNNRGGVPLPPDEPITRKISSDIFKQTPPF